MTALSHRGLAGPSPCSGTKAAKSGPGNLTQRETGREGLHFSNLLTLGVVRVSPRAEPGSSPGCGRVPRALRDPLPVKPPNPDRAGAGGTKGQRARALSRAGPAAAAPALPQRRAGREERQSSPRTAPAQRLLSALLCRDPTAHPSLPPGRVTEGFSLAGKPTSSCSCLETAIPSWRGGGATESQVSKHLNHTPAAAHGVPELTGHFTGAGGENRNPSADASPPKNEFYSHCSWAGTSHSSIQHLPAKPAKSCCFRATNAPEGS